MFSQLCQIVLRGFSSVCVEFLILWIVPSCSGCVVLVLEYFSVGAESFEDLHKNISHRSGKFRLSSLFLFVSSCFHMCVSGANLSYVVVGCCVLDLLRLLIKFLRSDLGRSYCSVCCLDPFRLSRFDKVITLNSVAEVAINWLNLMERVFVLFSFRFRMFFIFRFFLTLFWILSGCVKVFLLFLVHNVVFFCFGLFCNVFWAVQIVSGCFWLI